MAVTQPARRVGLWGVGAGALTWGLVALQGQESVGQSVRSVALLVAPVPLALAALRAGPIAGGIALGLSMTAVAMHAVWPAGLYFARMGLVVGFLVLATRHLLGWNGVVLGGLLLAAVVAGIDMVSNAQANERTVLEEYQAFFNEAETALSDVAAPAQSLTTEQRERLDAWRTLVLRFAPSLIVISYTFVVALAMMLAAAGARLLRVAHAGRGSIATWRLPEAFVFVFIAASAAGLLAWNRGWPEALTAAANVLVLLVCVYLAQGLAIIHAFARNLRVHPVLEAALLAVLISVLPLLMSVAMIGLFDFHMDFRGRWLPPTPEPGEPHSQA